MIEQVILTCPSCGGKLHITSDIDRFACAYCGTELIVRRGIGIVSLSPVVDGIQEVKQGVDKTASELALVRLKEDLKVAESYLEKVKKEKGEGDNSTGCVLSFFLIVGVFLIILNEVASGIIVMLLGFGFTAWEIYSKKKKEEDPELKKAKSNVEQINSEIRKHERIVSPDR